MNADGSHLRQLTASSSDRTPEFSPNGGWIIFTRSTKRTHGATQVFIIASDGSHLRQLTHGQGASDPTFSPDGNRIVFVAYRKPTGFNIYTMRLNGSDLRQLTHVGPNAWDDEPDFSPDGHQIVFRCGEGDLGPAQRICIMRADGSRLQHLTRGGPPPFVAEHPVFSPDGRQIAFLAQPSCRSPGCGADHVILYRMRIDGSDRRRITDLGSRQSLGPLGVTWQPVP